MKTFVIIFAGILIFSITTNFTDQSVKIKHENDYLRTIIGPPPSSLNKFYPPAVDVPVYKIKMFNLASPFTAIGIEVQERNLSQAMAHFEKFKEEYIEISKMVPEWESGYPKAPVDELGMALADGETNAVFKAIGNVGRVCHDCHITNMAKVQQQYHWEDFSEIDIKDPVTNQDMEFNNFKMSLETAFSGAGLKLEQRQPENALKYFDSFNARFQTLKESCAACHDSERKYYVDNSIQKMIDELRFAIENPEQDMKIVGNLFQQIGNESCNKCHLVHIPAAYAKSQWKMQQLSLQD